MHKNVAQFVSSLFFVCLFVFFFHSFIRFHSCASQTFTIQWNKSPLKLQRIMIMDKNAFTRWTLHALYHFAYFVNTMQQITFFAVNLYISTFSVFFVFFFYFCTSVKLSFLEHSEVHTGEKEGRKWKISAKRHSVFSLCDSWNLLLYFYYHFFVIIILCHFLCINVLYLCDRNIFPFIFLHLLTLSTGMTYATDRSSYIRLWMCVIVLFDFKWLHWMIESICFLFWIASAKWKRNKSEIKRSERKKSFARDV